MSNIQALLPACGTGRPQAAIFLSGSGSNAEQILRRYQAEAQGGRRPGFDLAAIVTDAPQTSRARQLAQEYGLPLVAEDIREFYHRNGQKRVSIATAEGQQLRAQWTDRLRRQLEPMRITFGIFAGFVPLTNLTADFPCLNVHPGDLTCRRDGRRLLVGLHEVPIERAILEGMDCLRSSVILAGAYTGKGDDMDNGPLLGISPPVAVDLDGAHLAQLRAVAAGRPAARPAGGFHDELQQFAAQCQERLKEGGDWVVFPPVIWDFADDRFHLDLDSGRLLFRMGSGRLTPIETVEYGAGGRRELVFPGAEG